MAPSNIDATIAVGQKPAVEVEEVAVGNLPATLTIPPISVGIYQVPLNTTGRM
jgi:hypothetical protein